MILEPQFRNHAADRIWSADSRLQRMIAFEVALAAAEADLGLVPEDAATAIRRAGEAEGLDAETVHAAARDAGNPAIPFVAAFTAHVAAFSPDASRHVHFGATSQDVIDTAHMLALSETCALARMALTRVGRRLKALVDAHAETPMAARTLLQHATPITFGVKAAHWLVAVERARSTLARLRETGLLVQLAGASGTLSTLHPHGPAVRAGIAARLGLGDPGASWQTDRQPMLAVASALVGAIEVAAKIAGDLQFLSATEIGEVSEGLRGTGGGSTAMPHKRNPVDSLVPVAAGQVAAGLLGALAAAGVQEQERSPGRWHAEWILLPLVSTLSLAALDRLAELLDGLEVDKDRMNANLQILGGLLASEALASALADRLGRAEAKALSGELIVQARGQHQHLAAVAAADSRVTAVLDSGQRATIFSFQDAIAAAASEARRLAAGFDAD